MPTDKAVLKRGSDDNAYKCMTECSEMKRGLKFSALKRVLHAQVWEI